GAVRQRRVGQNRIAEDASAQSDAAHEPVLEQLLRAPAQPGGDGAGQAQVDGALGLAGEQSEVADAREVARAPRRPRELLQQGLEQEALLDRLHRRGPGPGEAPGAPAGPVHAGAAPVLELPGARNDARKLVAAT